MRLKIFMVGIGMICALTACVHSEDEMLLSDSLQRTVVKDTVTQRKTESVGIYIDTTPSMGGFVSNDVKKWQQTNYYDICMDETNRIVANLFDEEDLSFYRTDTSIWEMEKDNFEKYPLDEARLYGFYSNSKNLSDTYGLKNDGAGEGNYDFLCLKAALEHGESKDFFLLITDFYENGGNASQLIHAIKKVAGNDPKKIFGIVGIRSGFAGTIYDSGPGAESIEFGIKEEKSRSFYVIARGYPQDVESFCSRLKERMEAANADCEMCVFYEKDILGIDYHDFQECRLYKKGLIWNDGLNVTIDGAVNMPVYSYKKSDGSERRQLFFSYSIPEQLMENFKDIDEKIGKPENVSLGTGFNQELQNISGLVTDKEIAIWSTANERFQKIDFGDNGFEIEGVYFDENSKRLYVLLYLQDEVIPETVCRIRWKNFLDTADSLSYEWSKTWNYESGEEDFEKTERLNDYFEAFSQSMRSPNKCFFDGVIYLSVEG